MFNKFLKKISKSFLKIYKKFFKNLQKKVLNFQINTLDQKKCRGIIFSDIFWKNNKAKLNLQNLEANLQILLILFNFAKNFFKYSFKKN